MRLFTKWHNYGWVSVTEHKTFEWEILVDQICLALNIHFNIDYYGLVMSMNIFGLFGYDIHFTRCEDHAGIRFGITLFGITGQIELYDNRHWNYSENRWYNPGEEEE